MYKKKTASCHPIAACNGVQPKQPLVFPFDGGSGTISLNFFFFFGSRGWLSNDAPYDLLSTLPPLFLHLVSRPLITIGVASMQKNSTCFPKKGWSI